MALTNIEQPIESNPDKSIHIHVSTTNTVMYTVPPGRKFVGYFVAEYASFSSRYKINDVGFNGSQYTRDDITLLAGDVISTYSYGGSLSGIESDA